MAKSDGPKPTTQTDTIKIGYQRTFYGRHSYKYLDAIKRHTRHIEQLCAECTVCGKPATRKFHGKSGFYGRCTKHAADGEIPRSYKTESIKERLKCSE